MLPHRIWTRTAEASPLELFEKKFTISDAEKIDNAKSSSQYEKREDLGLCVPNELGFARIVPLVGTEDLIWRLLFY